MKSYEFMLLLDPTKSEKEREKTLDSIKKEIEERGGSIEKEDIWGEKALAYKINRSDKGFYVLYTLSIDGNHLKEITKNLNLMQDVWRHIFVKKES